jgi:hypothetical protein
VLYLVAIEKLDGASSGMAGRVAADADPSDVEGVVEGCVVVACDAEEMERDRARVVGFGGCCQVGAVVEDRLGAFDDRSLPGAAIEQMWCAGLLDRHGLGRQPAGPQVASPTCRRSPTSWVTAEQDGSTWRDSHQSGRAGGCSVGSPSNSSRRRPHCRGGG